MQLVRHEIKLRNIATKYKSGSPKQCNKLRDPTRPTHSAILDMLAEKEREIRTAQYDKVRAYNESRDEALG